MEPCAAEAGVLPFCWVKKGEHVSHTVPLMNPEGLAARSRASPFRRSQTGGTILNTVCPR